MSKIEDQIIDQFCTIVENIKNIEQHLLNEVLTMQKILNFTHRTQLNKHRNTQLIKEKDQEQYLSKEINQKQVFQQIDQILIEADKEVKNIENFNKQKIKYQIKPLPIPEKKPPLPTVNRVVEKTQNKIIPTKFIPPRNKNQVTGKVTETSIHKSNKVFKPQKSNKSIQKKQVKSLTKKVEVKKIQENNKSEEIKKPQEIKEKIVVKSQKLKDKPQQNVPLSLQKKQIKEISNKDIFRLAQLHKNVDQILEERANKKIKNKRHLLEKLIQTCQKQEVGYRANEQKGRQKFIKHFARLSATKIKYQQLLPSNSSRTWDIYPFTFQFEQVLSNFQRQLGDIVIDPQYRLDPKVQYRLHFMHHELLEEFQRVQAGAEALVPDQIDLTFSFKKQQNSNKSKENRKQIYIGQVPLYEKLLKMLDEVTAAETLTKRQLSKLRVLTESLLYDSRRSATIVQTAQFHSWQTCYLDN